jgi:pyruvate formate lyase activating enzyme
VVFSGGEPTRQLGVVEAARQVRELGFQVGLHTGGAYPRRIEKLLPYLDWVGFDVKATPDKYAAVTGVPGDGSVALESLRTLVSAGIEVQVRTTLDPLVLDEDDILEIREQVYALGVTDYVVQRVRTEGTNPEYGRALEEYRSKASHGANDILPLV